MKFNILYIFWIVLLFVAIGLVIRFANSSRTTLFGSAEIQGQILNVEYAVLVQKIFVHVGDPIRKGDTLMILQRPELDKQVVLKDNEKQVNRAEQIARAGTVDNQLERLKSEYTTKINELKTQIQLLESEEKAQAAVRLLVENGKPSNTKSLLVEKINLLKNAISVEQQRFAAQSNELNLQRQAEVSVFDSKANSVDNELTFLEEAKGKLVLLAPIDGFIERVQTFENEIAPQYKELMKINPKQPDMVKGFLPESAEVMYQMGDSVSMTSATRPYIVSKGRIIGSSPQLVELPMRLKRLQQTNSWGREIFVKLRPDNEFFIGEKIIITITPRK